MATLITGGGGFIGRRLVAHLASAAPGDSIVTLGLNAPAQPGVRHVACDMLDEEATARAVAEIAPARVYHLAGSAKVSEGIGMAEYFRTNYLTTISLLRALERLGAPVDLFFSSSVHVYGNQEGAITEATPVHPAGHYGFTKYLAEEALRHGTKRCEKLSVVVGRLYTCIGPGQGEGFVAADLCRKIAALPAAGGILKTRSLEGFRCFLDVRDAVRTFPALLAARRESRFEVFNVASPHELAIGEMVKLLVRLSGKSPRIESEEDKDNPFRGLRLDIGKLRKSLPRHAFRPLEETLRDMLAATSP